MDMIDTDIIPEDRIFRDLDENQTMENSESEEPEEYDYSCYK